MPGLRGGKHVHIEPVRQAREACYALRDYIESDPRWTLKRSRWDHVVVLPNTKLPDDFALPECPRWKIIDRTDLPNLVHKLQHILIRQEIDRPLLTQDGIAQLQIALSGRGLPQRNVVARALANEGAADALTEHQAVILDAIRLLHRVEVRGGAGSGKTFLAVEQARRLSARGQRVALVCYSHGLASYLERITANWPRRQRPAYVGEFHALGVLWGAPEGPDESVRTEETEQFWEHDLPLQMSDLAAQLEPGHRFDSIVVDEAQDFADAWWDPLLAALKDDETGGLYVFTDEGQRVFSRHGSPPVPLVPLILDQNVRNTRQIANVFQPLVDHPMRFLGGDGPAVTFVACGRDEAMDVGDDQIEALLDDGWRPEDLALLTTGSRHPEQIAAPDRRPRRVLEFVLGHRSGVLRPRARLQGARASRRRPGRQRGRTIRALPRAPLRRTVARPRPARGVRGSRVHPRSRRTRPGPTAEHPVDVVSLSCRSKAGTKAHGANGSRPENVIPLRENGAVTDTITERLHIVEGSDWKDAVIALLESRSPLPSVAVWLRRSPRR